MVFIEQQKIRIRLKAYDHFLLDDYCQKIINVAKINNFKTVGPIPLPTKKKIYCVLRSPHVDKDSREHFEIRIHQRIIDIYQPSIKIFHVFMKLNNLQESGVDIEVMCK
uniref:Ribosomal protein S10 n=1 Tax=Cyanoptyche gloeocystis TaxID=77922 RepID=A0A3G1IWD4_9EUKA|nr:ribosomal protein S10 [Cyanoptyche gloeocystis]